MDKAVEQTARALAQLGSNNQPSKGFQNLIRQVGEAKTKHEEDRIIKKEAALLKERVGARDVSQRQMREYLIRLIYCEMLGLECSWGYIHAVKFTQSGSTLDKRIGYLASSLFLHQDHELNVLLVSTIQKDLKSSNMLHVSMALTFICKLVGADMIPPLLPLVQDKMLHPKELVRKKAVMAMHHFLTISPEAVSHLENDFRRSLSDLDPGVMEASLVLFHDLIKTDPGRYKDLTESFVSILIQVIERKLPPEFSYHGVPSPWIQMRLLRILALLGADDLKTSEKIYSVVGTVLASAECNSDVGQAISYECICVVATIYPNSEVISKTAQALSRFVKSTNNNWRYLGINALASLVQVNPKYALEHQMVVIDCLDDPDETLKRKTLDLLYKMTNPVNVLVITEKLIGYLRQTRDEYIRADLVSKVTQLAERFAPDNMWFIQTMNSVFELGGNLVRREVAHNLMRLLAEGNEDEEADTELRRDAVSAYIELLDKPHLPDILIKIICWVVGEYSYLLADNVDTEEILDKITALLGRRFEERATGSWVVSCVTKLVARLGSVPDTSQSQVAILLASTDTDIQQRCNELLELSQDLQMMQSALPLDSACEDLEVDPSLSFLDHFVAEALSQGASAYRPAHLRPLNQETKLQEHKKEIKYKEYPLPAPPTPSLLMPRHHDDLLPMATAPTLAPVAQQESMATHNTYQITTLDLPSAGIAVRSQQRPWGREGYSKATPTISVETHPPQPSTIALEEESEGGRGGGGGGGAGGGDSEEKVKSSATSQLTLVEANIIQPSPEERQKIKLANQIFGPAGGLSNTPRPPKYKQRRGAGLGAKTDRTAPSIVTATRYQISGPPQADMDLLLDIDFSQSAPTPSDAAAHPQVAMEMNFDPLAPLSSGGGGLLANMEIRHDNPPAAPPSSAPSLLSGSWGSSTSTDLLGLFDAPVAMTTPDNPEHLAPQLEHALAPQLTSDLSLLDPAPSITVHKIGASQGALALSLLETPLTSFKVPPEYSHLPPVPGWENKDVYQDANLRVSVTKLLKPDKLVLILFLTNQKQAELSEVCLSLQPSSNLKTTAGSSSEGDLGLKTSLTSFATTNHVVAVAPSSPALNMVLRGELTYKVTTAIQKRLFFDASISCSDLIRPRKISTQEYGKKWTSLTNEKKVKVQSQDIENASQFMDRVQTSLNLHPIQIIGPEAIAAGTFLPQMACLLHGKVTSTNLDLRIRTSSRLLTDSLAKLVQQVFK